MIERDQELIAALTAADPIDLDAVPAPDRALLEEIMMTDPANSPRSTPVETPRRRTPVVAAAALMLVTGVGVGALALNDGSKAADPAATTARALTRAPIDPAPRTGLDPGGISTSCMVWDVTSLDLTAYAFDGTVTEIDNGWVTFEVGEWFKGPSGDLVTLNAEALTARDGGIATSVDELLITDVGQRLLVSGSDGFAGVCNQTQAYTAAEADAWRAQLST